jgi:hypothetical protein
MGYERIKTNTLQNMLLTQEAITLNGGGASEGDSNDEEQMDEGDTDGPAAVNPLGKADVEEIKAQIEALELEISRTDQAMTNTSEALSTARVESMALADTQARFQKEVCVTSAAQSFVRFAKFPLNIFVLQKY